MSTELSSVSKTLNLLAHVTPTRPEIGFGKEKGSFEDLITVSRDITHNWGGTVPTNVEQAWSNSQ